jgi:hypothetical protein
MNSEQCFSRVTTKVVGLVAAVLITRAAKLTLLDIKVSSLLSKKKGTTSKHWLTHSF